MSIREYAAIHLRVPNSGVDWLDEMIRTARRDDIAAQARQGELASVSDASAADDMATCRQKTNYRDAFGVGTGSEIEMLMEYRGPNGTIESLWEPGIVMSKNPAAKSFIAAGTRDPKTRFLFYYEDKNWRMRDRNDD